MQAAADASGRSIAQEIELRLEQSFRDDERAKLFADLYYGQELAALLEVIGRALKDAGTHAAANSARAGLGPANWLQNPHGYAVAVEAVDYVMEALRPPGAITAPTHPSRAEARLGEAIANGLLASVCHDPAPGDFMEDWATGLRPRLGLLRDRLANFDYEVGAYSVVLPSATTPGVLLYDSDDRGLLEESDQ